MSKRKILSLALTVCMIAILAVGGTLAYFMDTDSATNTFTTGKVNIDLVEDYTPNSKLLPGTKDVNNVKKVVTVKNENDSENSYVRLHIALPAKMVDQDLMSYNDMLHWNFSADAYAAGKWSMQPNYTTGNGWTDNGRANQNVYNTTINNEEYTVWVVTYRSELAPGATTEAAMTQVYLDWRSETTDGQTYTKANYDANGNKLEGSMSYTVPATGIKIEIIAEGTQADKGFTDAYDALNKAFGTPGSYNPWVK